MIIYDYSYEYQIKPFKVVDETLELREIIHEIKSCENIGHEPTRVLLTVNSQEIVIHYPSDLTDHVTDILENELRNLHSKMSLFVADTVITLDILIIENEEITDSKSHLVLIIDLLNFNGVDYRTTELRVRKGLARTFFQGFISSANLKISEMINVFNSIHDMEIDNQPTQGITKHELFGFQTSTHENFDQIIIRDESSTYNVEENDEWRLIDIQSIPGDLRVLF